MSEISFNVNIMPEQTANNVEKLSEGAMRYTCYCDFCK